MGAVLPSLEHGPIDIHSHFNHGSPFDQLFDGYGDYSRCDFDFLKTEYDNIGVTAAVFSSFAAVLSHCECIPDENRYLHDKANALPWIYQWVVVDPRRKETYEQAEAMLKSPKCIGIKIHPGNHGYDIVDYADELFGFANALHTTVLMHPDKEGLMPRYADKYPDMNLIIAHLGGRHFVDAVAEAKFGNIYTDTSGCASVNNHLLEYAVSRVGSGHILFGTDTYSCPFQFGRVALSRLPETDKQNILYRNAMNLFPGKF